MIECILFVPDEDKSKSKRWGCEGNGPQSGQWGRVVLIQIIYLWDYTSHIIFFTPYTFSFITEHSKGLIKNNTVLRKRQKIYQNNDAGVTININCR